MPLPVLPVQGYNTCKPMQTQSVSVERFQRHEDLDEERHVSNTTRLTAIETGQGYIRGWLAALGAVILFVAPFLNHFVSAWLSPGKP